MKKKVSVITGGHGGMGSAAAKELPLSVNIAFPIGFTFQTNIYFR